MASRASPPPLWRLSEVKFGDVLRQQDWGTTIGTILIPIVILAVVGGTSSLNEQPFSLADTTIAYPDLPSSVPYWVALLVSFAGLAISVAAGELALALHTSATNAASAVLFFLLDGTGAWAVTTLLTIVLKMGVGRLRPDFLARCAPEEPSVAPLPAFGRTASDNPKCTAPSSSHLTDGHFSFPSGHTSTVFVLAVYSCCYCVWAFWGRVPASGRARAKGGLAARLARDGGAAAALAWTLWLLCFAWGVSASRIIDFKHHVGDVAAGALLGSLFGGLFAGRAILCHRCCLAEEEEPLGGDGMLLAPCAAAGGGPSSSAPV